ncbi:hypothetical protein [Phenylobacterium ferrooxidans]|uniref:Uncharacterized protein n=1 Tax=Phenylobacterium ferrooxidans TaxID=2982689 RepID=A0ABW6CSZ9_9CAUL
MSLLANAVGAIQIAIEDFDSPDDRRVHAAIRNLHAGILLLCKVKLQRMSPPGSDEVLLKQGVEPHQTPNGDIIWHGTGRKEPARVPRAARCFEEVALSDPGRLEIRETLLKASISRRLISMRGFGLCIGVEAGPRQLCA